MGLNSLHNFTPEDDIFVAHVMMGFSLPGTCLSVVVLAAFAVVAWNPVSRPYLDRVSLRLLTYAIIANIFFAIAFILDTSLNGPSPGCNFVAFLTNISLLFSACLLFCIALNLQLVLVHGLNGNKMEKWYLIGSTLVACALNVPVYALNQFGWNETNSTCWFSNPNDKIRLRWTIGTQSFWVLLIASGETVMGVIVIWYILWCDRISRKMAPGAVTNSTMNHVSKMGDHATASRATISRGGYSTRYRNIILRIGLYPLVSCILNYSTVALDLYQTVDGVNTNLQFYMSILDLCLYGLRTFFYAALAATDPSFLRAVRVLRDSHTPLIPTHTSYFQAATRGSRILTTKLDVGINSHAAAKVDAEGGQLELQHMHHMDAEAAVVTRDAGGYTNEQDSEMGRLGFPESTSCCDQERGSTAGDWDTRPQSFPSGHGLVDMATRAEAVREPPEEESGEEERASREFTRQI